MKTVAMSGFAYLIMAMSGGGLAPTPADALDGVDPVVLIEQGREVDGKPEHSVVRGHLRYMFASADSQAAFEATPSRYEVQFGGLCARMGRAVTGNPADFVVHDGRIYVFGSDECHRQFEAAPSKFLPPAPARLPDAPGAMTGAGLLERAVAALGGRGRFDAVRTYVELASQVQARPSGQVPVTRVTMWRSSGELRQERSLTVMDRRLTITTVLTPGAGWYLGQDGQTRPMLDGARAYLETDAQRQPFAILGTRPGEGTTVAALTPATVQGMRVEPVRIVRGGLDVTLGVDPASGEPRTIAFIDRNDEGVFGRLPFQVRAFFNGASDPSQSWTLESVRINEPLDDSLFRGPGH